MPESIWYCILTVCMMVGIPGALVLLALGASEPNVYSTDYPFGRSTTSRGKPYFWAALACVVGWVPFGFLVKKVDYWAAPMIVAVIADLLVIVILVVRYNGSTRGRDRVSTCVHSSE
ncbi:MAG: hypothetical protein PHH01_00290 [Patescibacteria group bacterium]|nr:hypothetical protein [Patescibacteria group bacterium]